MSDRDLYLAMVGTGPLMAADAIVVLCGEDADPRLTYALQLFRDHAESALAKGIPLPFLLLSGGRHEPPRIRGAKELREKAIGFGVPPNRILTDTLAMHTRQQAENVVLLATDRKWRTVLLVASPYHVPRAHLTFVKALLDAGQANQVRVVMVPASQSRWYVPPDGCDTTRADLFSSELAKIEAYEAKGDVASYAAGLAYLKHWELRAAA